MTNPFPKEVIVRLNGGLGNQMFQYAAGSAYAERCGAHLSIDTTSFDGVKLRRYALDSFALSRESKPRRWVFSPLFRLAHSQSALPGSVTVAMRRLFNTQQIIETRIHQVDHRLLCPHIFKKVCLAGYWQSPGYFADRAASIRRAFEFLNPPDSSNVAVLSKIRNVNSVSLHIRRGDYLQLPQSPVLPLSYYQRAASLVAAKVGNPHFFVFSDDLPWAEANLKLPAAMTFVDVNRSAKEAEDLRLMSSCSHHIIANSSFSWWGAWLNASPSKVVVAPKYWMCKPDSYYPDLFPADWECLDNLN